MFLVTVACEDHTCRWTDDPNNPDDSIVPDEPETPFATDGGLFRLVMRADGPWPPVAGVTSLQVEWAAADLAPPDAALFIDRPYILGSNVVAPAAPFVVDVHPGIWRIEQLALVSPGLWALPIWLEDGELDDSIELHVEVIDSPE